MTVEAAGRTGLGDLLDRLLERGAVVTGDVVIGLADIDLVLLELRALLTGVEAARRRAGVDADDLPHRAVTAAPEPRGSAELPRRIRLDDERPERGIAGLLVLLADVLRDLVEGQAIARLEGGSLTDPEIERLGRALQALDERLNELHRWLRQL
jgi:hypothetical protein